MPSVGIHYIVIDKVTDALRYQNDPLSQARLSAVTKYPEYAYLGSIGPDLFYYTKGTTSLGAAIADVFHAFKSITDAMQGIGKRVEEVGLDNIGKFLEEIGKTSELAMGAALNQLSAKIVVLVNMFTGEGVFGQSEIQKNEPAHKWNWGDLLHDRFSGGYAAHIDSNAKKLGKLPWLSYTTGYYTHLAADAVGHPYVNSVVGGPARGWNLRHTIAEKFMDAQVYHRAGKDINKSRLHENLRLLYHSKEMEELAQMLSGSLSPFSLVPSIPRKKDILDALENFFSLIQLSTEDFFIDPPEFPHIVIPPLPGQHGTLLHSLVGSNNFTQRPQSLTDWLKLLLAILALIPAVIADFVVFFVDIVAGTVLYPARVALYLFQSMLYKVYRDIRWFLVLSGLAFPAVDELQSTLGKQFATCRAPHEEGYPHIPPSVLSLPESFMGKSFISNNLAYLTYPKGVRGERPNTQACPYPAGTKPEFFIDELGTDRGFIKDWERCHDPTVLRALVNRISISSTGSPVGGFGNAVDFSLLLMQEPSLGVHLNLDADRGYAYKHWQCPGDFNTGDLSREEFI